MSTEQAKIQQSVFHRDHPITPEEALFELHDIGVMNLDGTFTEEYKFLDPNWRPTVK